MNTAQELLKMKEKIKKSEAELNREQGLLSGLEKQLKEEYGITETEEIEDKIKKYERKQKHHQITFDKMFEKLKKEWNENGF